MLTVLIVFLALTFESSGYLVAPSQSRCPRPPSCSCDYHDVLTCGGKTNPISQVPIFLRNPTAKTANLTDNSITSLSGKPFTNLPTVSNLFLERNRISTIDPMAFSGLYLNTLNISNNQLRTLRLSDIHAQALDVSNNELYTLSLSGLTALKALVVAHNRLQTIPQTGLETLEKLDVSYNELQTVPETIKNMTKLRDLRIHYNPIKAIQPSFELLALVGCSLHTLYFGSPELQSWSTHLYYLRNLQTLSLNGLNMTLLQRDAFKGLGHTSIQNLFIENTGLQGIPAAICDFHSLRMLKFSDNLMSDSRHLVPSCQAPFLDVYSVYLDNNSLTSFPDIYSIFPNVTRLYINNNPRLTKISSHKIPNGKGTGFLYLNGNGFTSIPSALEKLTHLMQLELNDNKITSISRVLNFTNLHGLYLNSNPIHSISPSAFLKINRLTLSLVNTGQTTIPKALSAIKGMLWTVNLRQNPIRCTCTLKWAKPWLTTKHPCTSWCFPTHHLEGNCYGSNNATLYSYVMQNTTLCH